MRWWQWLLCAVAAALVLVALWCVSEYLRRVVVSIALFVLFAAFATAS